MSIIKKLILYIKHMFTKKLEVKAFPEIERDGKLKFIEDLRVSTAEKSMNKKIYTLISKGDGLGIQKKMNY